MSYGSDKLAHMLESLLGDMPVKLTVDGKTYEAVGLRTRGVPVYDHVTGQWVGAHAELLLKESDP